MKKIIALLLVLVTLVACFAACGADAELEGKWENEKTGRFLEFADGKCTETVDGTTLVYDYDTETEEDYGILTLSVNGVDVLTYQYKIENGVLMLVDNGIKTSYKRV